MRDREKLSSKQFVTIAWAPTGVALQAVITGFRSGYPANHKAYGKGL